jgi:transcriptional regulator with XRE-family HTH domain
MVHSLFADELRRTRELAGMSQADLATAMAYSVSAVAMVETGRRPPTKDFSDHADTALKTDGLFGRIRQWSLRQRAQPEWFTAYRDIEDQATTIRAFNPLVVYGLVQTEAYARAQLRSDDPEATESRVAARMERQRDIFDREKPPSVTVLLDEAVLYRNITGGAPDGNRVMHDQLIRLTEGPGSVQIVPASAATPLGLDGAFELARLDGREVAYVETPLLGFVLDQAEYAQQAGERWTALVAEALPLRQSRELIAKVAQERWKIDS